MKKLFCFLLMLASLQAHATEQEKPAFLAPDQAFQFKAEAVSPSMVKASWDIAEGHYLSREQFKFETETSGVSLSPAQFPPGVSKEDAATQSKHEVYRKHVDINIPVERGQTSAQAVQLALKVKYQGCSDNGLCLPPIRKTADLQLAAIDAAPKTAVAEAATPAETPTPAPTTQPSSSSSILPNIFQKPQADEQGKPLPVDEAFAFDMTAVNQGILDAHWAIQPGHHLYKPKITFSVKSPQGVTLGKPVFPTGQQVDDEYFGKIEVFSDDIHVRVPILQTGDLEKIIVTTQYQGCSDTTGTCYTPVKKDNEIKLAGLPAADTSNMEEVAAAPQKLNKQDALAQKLEGSNFFQKILIMFMAGLLLAFTPCIFPMIPILSGIIAGYGNTSSRKAFFLSLTYVWAGATAYALIGFVFGFFGQNLQTVLQHPIAIGLMSVLFVLLALSMFGFYDLQLPNSLQSRLSEISNKQESGSFIGAAIMGFLSTLIVGPCAGPVIAGALTYIAQSKDALLGATALFSMGVGIGVPLLLIGMSAGHLLPRAGAWMDTVKAVFGIIMLGIAIYMLSRIVPPEITMALTGILLVSSGVYMGALEKTSEEAGGWGRFWKSTGMIQLFYGGLILLGLAAGSQNLLQPLKGVFAVSAGEHAETGIHFQRIKGVAGLDAALEQAKAQNRPVMLDFTASWCTYCQGMEKTTFKSPEVASAMGNTLFIQADVSKNDDDDLELEKRFGVTGPPALVFFSAQGKELRSQRLIGNVTPEQLTAQAEDFLAEAAK